MIDKAKLAAILHELLPDHVHGSLDEPYCEYMAVAIADRLAMDCDGFDPNNLSTGDALPDRS